MDLKPRSSKPSPAPPNPALPYREDCWSDGETAALVDSWGTRFLAVGRGILRQPQWQEVADAVNSRPTARNRRRPPRSDSQCKNRVDTLKKKYKIEKGKIAGGDCGGEFDGSSWQFYPRMHELLSDYVPPGGTKKFTPSPLRSGMQLPYSVPLWRPSEPKSPSPPPHYGLPLHKRDLLLPVATRASPQPKLVFDDSLFRSAAAAAAAAKDEDDVVESSDDEDDIQPPLALPPAKVPLTADLDDDSEDSDDELPPVDLRRETLKHGMKRILGDAEGGCQELARAIDGLAAVYEKVEMERLRRAAEAEQKQMEFMKELELERMRLLMDAQVQLTRRSKRIKREDDESFRQQ